MPTSRTHPEPTIPDHEVIRQIGGGAYGEVWLARGVTGALRAVKVVWREDFEDERGFDREFQGILKYEPMSRDHPGLVSILHVGRSPDGSSFYYYVMELGDDVLTGREINPIEYEARTLRSDVKAAGGKRLETAFCIDVGLRLAEALDHLHSKGLAHRDVKPSNVIFIGGKAQLADIGLVAARGQRTFVGTEGFVPPEGPGSAQADVYSLGKVLYEMATGKDRMEFPELPDEIPSGAERKQWLALNQVICEVCNPRVSRRGIRSAAELGAAMSALRVGRRRRRRRPVGAMLTAACALMLFGWGVAQLVGKRPWQAAGAAGPATGVAGGALAASGEGVASTSTTAVTEVAPREAFVKVTSSPDGADVLDQSGGLIGRTPTNVLESFVGEQLRLVLVKEGFEPYMIEHQVPAGAADEPLVLSAVLAVDSPPVAGQPWSDHLGASYRPVGVGHERNFLVTSRSWNAYAEAASRPDNAAVLTRVDEGGRRRRVAVTDEREARLFCDWLVREGTAQGYLNDGFEAIPLIDHEVEVDGLEGRARDEGWRPFRVRVQPVRFARVLVTSQPPGAEVYVNGASWGEAEGPLLVDRIRPGQVELFVSLEGFKPQTQRFRVNPGETKELAIQLQANLSVRLDRPWTNSLGMELVPAGKDWMVAVWETRVRDYYEFARATRNPVPDTIDGSGGWADHPVISVSRSEAEAFCQWLTEKERREERLTRSQAYRLPTDAEWSSLAGVSEEAELSPGQRDRFKTEEFFWGWEWPPPPGSGNLADASADLPAGRRIEGYDDGFPETSEVGSFPANELGVHDLCGNAQEWVADAYSSQPGADEGLLRGGGWMTYSEESLYLGARNPQPPDSHQLTFGFRVVLAREPSDAEEENGAVEVGGEG